MQTFRTPDGDITVDKGVATRWDGTELPATPDLLAYLERIQAAHDAAQNDAASLAAHRTALTAARELLLEYRYGAPGTPSFPEVLSPVQTAVLDYRDSGITDPECDAHIMWINARVNEINATALYAAKVLK